MDRIVFMLFALVASLSMCTEGHVKADVGNSPALAIAAPLIPLDPTQADGIALAFLSAAQHHQWSLLLALGLILASFGLNRFGVAIAKARGWTSVVAALGSDGGRLLIVFAGSVGGALVATLSSGATFNWPVFVSALAVALKAVGGFQVFKKAFWPPLAKLLGLAPLAGAALIFLGVLLPGGRAEACPIYTPSQGAGITLYKATMDKTGNLQINQVNVSAAYSWKLNFLPNSDCTLRFVSLVADAMIGGGHAAIGPGAAFNLTPAVGLGFLNSFIEVLAGYDALNIGTTSSGLFLGRLSASNFGIYAGLAVNFDFSNLLPTPATAELKSMRAAQQEPFAFVRL